MCYLGDLLASITSYFSGNDTKPVGSTPPTSDPNKQQGSTNLKVSCNWFQKENTSRHHTDEYENTCLVVRRGETFRLKLFFEGITFEEIMETVFRFKLEPENEALNCMNIDCCGFGEDTDESKWGVEIEEKDIDQLHLVLKVNIPVNAIIGRYEVNIIVPSHSIVPVQKSKIIVLFNPWNKDDDVYLEEEELRKEYVLNDTGLIYRGSATWGLKGILPKKWNYGQFEENVLDCVLRLLEKDKRFEKYPLKSIRKRNSAVWVARMFSAVLNCQNEDGLLEGNWSGDYDDGKAPTSWNGSEEIYQEYFVNEKPVKYGQCWVFSGVMTTALRALGIPARSVTNFDSAHDTDETMTIDAVINEDGDKVDELCDDSIWNFHVWNEMWSKRNDHPGKTYDGWQVVDATPQEESSQLYQMGPAPLNAVKEGEIFAGFDTGFVFAEVNADYVKWVVKKDHYGRIVFQEAAVQNVHHVGKCISTKKVGKDEREDITHLYKYPEKSTEERKAFDTAYSFGRGAKKWEGLLSVEKEGKDLKLDLDTTSGNTIVNGESFTCTIQVENTADRNITINVTGVLSSMEYTGKIKMLIKRKKFENVKIDAGEKTKLEIPIDVDEYITKLTDHNCFKFVVVGKVLDTGKQYIDDCILQLYNKDCIEIKFLETPLKVGQRSEVEICFTNPLPVRLYNLKYSIEGAGLSKPSKQKRRNLNSGQKQSVKFTFSPRKPGHRTLLVDIDSSKAKDFKASLDVEVVES